MADVRTRTYVTTSTINKENQVTYLWRVAFTSMRMTCPNIEQLFLDWRLVCKLACEWCSPHLGHGAMIWPIYFSMDRSMNGDGTIASLASFSNSRTLEDGVTYIRSPTIFTGFHPSPKTILDYSAFFEALLVILTKFLQRL